MTVGDWLDARSPRPPVALQERIRAVLGASLGSDATECAALCVAAGERLVAKLLQNNSTSRDSALDLLTADALVTYAFEAASEQPTGIDALAASAMTSIAALGSAIPVAGLAR